MAQDLATKEEMMYMDMVAKLPCSVCGDWPVELHHPREGQGTSTRSDHWLVVPLCVTCHRSNLGFHGGRNMMKIYKMEEMDMLSYTIQQMFRRLWRDHVARTKSD